MRGDVPEIDGRRALSRVAPHPGRSQLVETTLGIPLDAGLRRRRSSRRARRPSILRATSGARAQFPFTRGIHATMYRGRPWTMRQYAGFGTAEESNRRYKYLLASGQTGLSVAFDLPTQMGRDSDHPLARGEVGRVGVAIASIDDMHVLLDGHAARRGLDVDDHQRHGGDAAGALRRRRRRARHPAHARCRARSRTTSSRSTSRAGRTSTRRAPSMRLVADTFAFCRREVPRWNTISISGYHIREAGSDAVQEVAFTLADGIAYVEAARAAGLDVDEFAPRLSLLLQRPHQPARGGRQVPRRAPAVGADHARPLRRQGSRARRCCASTRRPRARR